MLRGVKNKVVAGGEKVVASGGKVVASGGKVVAGVAGVRKKEKERDPPRRRKSDFLATRAAAAPPDAPRRKTGVLIKYTNPLKGWKPRLFTLEMGLLTYKSVPGSEEEAGGGGGGGGGSGGDDAPRPSFSAGSGNHGGSGNMLSRVRRKLDSDKDKDKERDVRGVIEVQHAVVTADDSDLTRFAIDTGHDLFHVKAQSQQDRDEWLKALFESQRYFAAIVERAALRSPRGTVSAELPARGSAGASADSSAAALADDLKSADISGPRGHVDGVVGSKAAAEPEAESATPAVLRHSDESGSPLEDAVKDVAAGGLGSRSPSCGISSTLNRSPSASSTVCSQMEDDGLTEAAASRRTLVMELRRVVNTLVPGDPSSLNDLYDDVDAASGVRDLATWVLHVLQTDRAMMDRQIAAGIKKAIVRRDADDAFLLAGQSEGYDKEDDEAEFFDANSRPTSLMLSRAGSAAQAPGSDRAHEDYVADGSSIAQDSSSAATEGEDPAFYRVSTARLAATAVKVARKRLPELAAEPPKLNVWGILKDAAGKDLSKISIPVGLNEPISFLQRLAEDIEYSELLDQAAAEPDQHRRLLLVACMIISHYSSTQARTGKPSNPLLGETFSLVMPNKGNGVRFVAEQVSHHPPVSACYAEGSGGSWKYYNTMEVKNKFWGKSLEVFPTGWNHVEIPAFGDHYEFEQVTACVHNIFLGTSKMWLDNYGDMEIVNRATGDRCEIKFQKSGMFSDPSSLGSVVGTVFDADGKVRHKLCGRWPEAVYEDLPKRQKKLLWQVQKRPPLSASNNYNMTGWAIALNSPVTEDEATKLAPTDSRVRPDQRALECGEYDRAGIVKAALEDGQRARRSQMEAAGEEWKPKWFTMTTCSETGRSEYLFNEQYFRAEAEGEWKGCVDLFSCASNL